MKRTNTKDRDRKSTLISVAVVVVVELLYLALWAWILPQLEGQALAVLAVLGLIAGNIVVVAGVFVALRQRLEEWKGGEEHDAGQY
ncbi:MAG: hypothetical protein ACI3VN_02030 [Candidatus Onthomonas sp.]